MTAPAEHVIAKLEAHRSFHDLTRLHFTGIDVCALVDEIYRLRGQWAQAWAAALAGGVDLTQPTTPQRIVENVPRAASEVTT